MDAPISRCIVKEDGTRIYEDRSIKSGNLVTKAHGEVSTLSEGFSRGLRLNPKGNCLGWRPSPQQGYRWISYEEVDQKIDAFGSGLISMGLKPGMQNRDFRRQQPQLHDLHAGLLQIRHYITFARASALASRESETPTLDSIVVIEDFDRESKCLVQLSAFEDVVSMGQKIPRIAVPPSVDDVAVVCFTSGTTGSPKGAMLTHGNFCANAESFVRTDGVRRRMLPTDSRRNGGRRSRAAWRLQFTQSGGRPGDGLLRPRRDWRDLHQRPQRLQGILEGRGEDAGGRRPRRLAAHRGHWDVYRKGDAKDRGPEEAFL